MNWKWYMLFSIIGYSLYNRYVEQKKAEALGNVVGNLIGGVSGSNWNVGGSNGGYGG